MLQQKLLWRNIFIIVDQMNKIYSEKYLYFTNEQRMEICPQIGSNLNIIFIYSCKVFDWIALLWMIKNNVYVIQNINEFSDINCSINYFQSIHLLHYQKNQLH